jgi:aspartyl-tRNA(Asn)/glutamyl-tRNA(Gln) amidotransferase subunit A
MVIQSEVYAYHAENIAKHPERFLPETLVKLRHCAGIEMGTYIKARLKLDELRREAPKALTGVDILVTPTTPIPPPKASELPLKADDIIAKDNLMWRNTRPFNLSGLPTISIPCGFTKAGLPIGLQLSGAPGREGIVLRLAHAYQEATSWHLRRPEDRRIRVGGDDRLSDRGGICTQDCSVCLTS